AGNTSPRTSPTVTSGGVVFMGTPDGNLWALDAVTGAVLNSGTPILQTGQGLRMAPIVDGQWLFLITEDGILSAMTINSAYASAVRRSSVIPFYANRSRPSFTRASQ
ncbi:MAG TPA: PQQ-binding-like beta-propeller repeat protein, partial [Candidatus Baltobacteraceae bacterium]|nr:PQQ-binding-like beta-propeller repeat protein [Candidatus Baltobacteraceae bacterium]